MDTQNLRYGELVMVNCGDWRARRGWEGPYVYLFDVGDKAVVKRVRTGARLVVAKWRLARFWNAG